MSDLLNSISSSSSSSYDSSSNLLLAAFISLLLVILFVLLLHIYAKWYLSRRMRTTTVITSSLTLHPSSSSSSSSSSVINYRYHFRSHSGSEQQTNDPASAAGLHPSVIASIPLFVYINSRRPSNGGSEISWLADEESKNKMGVVVQHQQHQCVICLSGFGDGEVGRCLSGCGHGFHVECIDMWLLSHSSCPICRSPAAPLPLPLPPAALVDSKAAGGEEEEEEEVAVLISSASGRSEEADDDHHRHDNVQCVSQ